MKRWRFAGEAASAAPTPSSASGEEDGHAACRARLAASEAAFSEQGGRLVISQAALAAAEAAASELKAANEALAREKKALEAALASAEAEKGELRARLAAFGAGSSSVLRRSAPRPVHVEMSPFLARRRDFGAELPAGVLLALMDRAPSSKCAFLEILSGGSSFRVHDVLQCDIHQRRRR